MMIERAGHAAIGGRSSDRSLGLGLGLGLDGTQGVQQLFKFVIGNIARFLGDWLLGDGFFNRGLDRSDFVSRLRLGQARQRSE